LPVDGEVREAAPIFADRDLAVECSKLAPTLRAGKLRYREDISEGIASVPAAFVALMRGDNLGKAWVLVGA
jgi:NADPH-dependent curcumin reductase CurA